MRYPWFRLAIFTVGCAFPGWWLYEAAMNLLGPDPGKILVDRLGLGALTFLLVTLSMTPLQRLTGWPAWIVVRRQLGLWCFAYVVLHMASYIVFILGLDWGNWVSSCASALTSLWECWAFLACWRSRRRRIVTVSGGSARDGRSCTGWLMGFSGWDCCTSSGSFAQTCKSG